MRITKILATASFICIAVALYIIAITPPATGYELDIYGVYPPYFWFLLIASIACGVCLLVHQAFSNEKSNWWLVGFLVIIFSKLIILALPNFRDYALYGREDALSHLGYMKDILITGHIGGDNFYPITHILGANILGITELSLGAVSFLLRALFSTIYMVNIYLLASVIASKRGQALLATAFASPFIYSYFHLELHPSFLSLFMFPLLLYLYHRRERFSFGSVRWSVLLLILLFLITFFHPETVLFAIVIFLTFGLSSGLYRLVLSYKKSNPESTWIGKNYSRLSLIAFIVFFGWYFSYATTTSTFKAVWDWLFHQIGYSTYGLYTEALLHTTTPPSEIARYLFNNYGVIYLYSLVLLISILFIFKRTVFKRDRIDPVIFTYGVILIVALLTVLYYWFAYPQPMNIIRVSRFFLVLSPVLIGLVLYELAGRQFGHRINRRRLFPARQLVIGFILLVIIGASLVSVLNVYRSPRIYLWNEQVTRYEIEGTKWLIEHQDGQTAIQSFLVKPHRFAQLALGTQQAQDYGGMMKESKYIPPHFGYNRYSSAAETFNFSDRYLITAEIDRKYEMTLPEYTRYEQYNEDDFIRLNSDATVMKVYANGELEVWRVYGKEAKQS